ncbi:MAG TPA: MFS transporter [Nocardioidaceae bacterium]|nr:MFS transporter [Nocardioidaceae bacterium]
MSESTRAEGQRFGLWHHADFRRLWAAETVSKFGTNISQIALPLVAILVVEASTFEVGLLVTFETLAFLIVGLPAGAWVDRMRMRQVLIINDVIRAVAIGSVPLAAWLDVLGMYQLYVVALVVGVSTVFFDVAYQSYLPTLVSREELVEGNSKLTASESIAQIAGPGLAGVLIQVFTAPYAILIDALSFLWSASWVTAIKTRSAKPERKPDRHLGREIGEGVRFVFGNRLLRSIAMCTSTSNLFNSVGGAVFLLLLARELDLSAGVIGAMMSASAVGALLGSLVARRLAEWLGQGPIMWISILVSAPFGFIAPFLERNWTLGLFVVGQLVFMASVVIYNIAQVSFRQGLTPPQLLGRMNATMRFIVWGTMPIGAFLGGVLGSTIGVRETLLVSAVGMSLSWLPIFFSPLRTMRELPQYVDPELTVASEDAPA